MCGCDLHVYTWVVPRQHICQSFLYRGPFMEFVVSAGVVSVREMSWTEILALKKQMLGS
jgi:hypothetical protein